MGINPRYFFREVFQSFKRNLLLNISSISTVMVLTFQLGFFILIIANINHFSSSALDKLQITAELSPKLSVERINELKERILKQPDVLTADFISKKEAFERLQKRLKDKVDLKNLTSNPLPDTLEVKLKSPEKIQEIAEEIDDYPGVVQTIYGDTRIIDKLIKLSHRIWIVGILIIGMLMISAIFLIYNTIRLTVYSRSREIAIMELVGATQWFIRGPFITEGLMHGVVGSSISVILLYFIYSAGIEWVVKGIPFITILPPQDIALSLGLWLLGVGSLVGCLSALASVNKYLKV